MRWIALIVLVCGFALPAFAEDTLGAREGGTIFAVQERKFRPSHEFHMSTGWLPQDAFWKGYTLDASYRYHFGEFFALEVFRFTLSRNIDTDLKQQLLTDFPESLQADPFEEVQFMFTVHAIFKPFYGKSALMNRHVLRDELYFMVGVGGINWRIDKKITGIRPTVDFGIGLRYWISKRTTIRLEALENVFLEADGSVDDMIYLSIGISVSTHRNARP